MNPRHLRDTIHIAIRAGVVESPKDEKEREIDLIEEHNRIAEKYSVALFGKRGRIPQKHNLDRLIHSVKVRNGAKLILIRKSKGVFDGYSAPLHNVCNGEDFTPNLSLVPSYYHHLIPDIALWFEIGLFAPMNNKDLERLTLFSSGKSLLETMSVCRTSTMLVRKGIHRGR